MTRNQTEILQPVVSGSGDQAASPPARTMTFYAPGLKHHKTAEYAQQNPAEFVSISVTGTGCALACEHCKSGVLRGMAALPRAGASLYDLCADAKSRGARGVLISGGSDRRGRPYPIEGSDFQLPVDMVVVAYGNRPHPLVPQTTDGLHVSSRGTIITEPGTGATSLKGVFAGGDIATGAATVIQAMGAGKDAARAIFTYLSGQRE